MFWTWSKDLCSMHSCLFLSDQWERWHRLLSVNVVRQPLCYKSGTGWKLAQQCGLVHSHIQVSIRMWLAQVLCITSNYIFSLHVSAFFLHSHFEDWSGDGFIPKSSKCLFNLCQCKLLPDGWMARWTGGWMSVKTYFPAFKVKYVA